VTAYGSRPKTYFCKQRVPMTSWTCNTTPVQRIGPNGALPPGPGAEFTRKGYEFWPDGLETAIRYASAVAQVPVIVTENGVATEDDLRRIVYVKRALAGVARCLGDGIDVRG
jgi:beta-glucosidase